MTTEDERLRRWRLVLGAPAGDALGVDLGPADAGMDGALAALYDGERGAGLGASSPKVAAWLGDIRTYFPTPVVQVLQQDALERFNLHQLLMEPELLAALEPDVHLVTTLMALRHALPEGSRETARTVVRRVVRELERRLRERTVQAVRGALAKASRTSRPRASEIDWDRTIRKNLRTYDPARKTLVPAQLVGYNHRRPGLKEVVLCVDQSGSMATSVVYAGLFAAVLASLQALKLRMVVFDTAVVDLSALLADPVDVLFGTQLGGGTDINAALGYCEGLIQRPSDTVLVLISDLYEGGDAREMLARAARLVAQGVQVIALLALADEGAPSYDPRHAAAFAAMGVPTFACTPDRFPGLMAAALQRQDLAQWAAGEELVLIRPS